MADSYSSMTANFSAAVLVRLKSRPAEIAARAFMARSRVLI
jgi:hypothetical protein